MQREPLAIRAAVIAVIDALIHLFVVFGVDWTGDQVTAISALVNVVSIAAVVILSRGKVTPVGDPDFDAIAAYAERRA